MHEIHFAFRDYAEFVLKSYPCYEFCRQKHGQWQFCMNLLVLFLLLLTHAPFLSDHFYLLMPFVCSDLANTGRLATSGNSFMGKQHLCYNCILLLPSVVPILHLKYVTANVCLKFSGKMKADGIFNL